MAIPVEALISALVFAAVLLLVQGVALLAFGRRLRLARRIDRRLDRLDRGEDRTRAIERLRKEVTEHLRAGPLPVRAALARRARRADLDLSPERLLLLMVAVAALVVALLTLGTAASVPVRAAAGLAGGVGGVLLWLDRRAARRLSLIEEQLPDAIELMVRSLRVGHPLAAALGLAAREVPAPLGTELAQIADEAAYGRDLGESLGALAERVDLSDLRFLAVAVSIQAQSGGNLAEILEGLAQVIRARFKLFRRVRAITAEATWSGRFLSAFPLAVLAAINLIDPHYYDDVRGSPYVLPAGLAVAGLLLANILVMRALVKIRI
ncbi:type II secretion system F family protein [Rubellimicrobium aerolatum]|uniref:Type II secretion system F family protein n=1 Tax=Rubellimicrobium aerolatum TaxID=490979 RepID=A0ABW0SFC2_9RHOB|nr:type II secretion system F family protein [Rubellimicrobium aerolatum]MBP1807136.1 tight adherence protein B [Rubellimicrobium aerolatum]